MVVDCEEASWINCLQMTLKAAWYAVKQAFIDKKRAVGLRGEVEKVEIVVLISQAIQSSFADITYSKLAASATGWNPPTMNI
jgi:hypothetical protein